MVHNALLNVLQMIINLVFDNCCKLDIPRQSSLVRNLFKKFSKSTFHQTNSGI